MILRISDLVYSSFRFRGEGGGAAKLNQAVLNSSTQLEASPWRSPDASTSSPTCSEGKETRECQEEASSSAELPRPLALEQFPEPVSESRPGSPLWLLALRPDLVP